MPPITLTTSLHSQHFSGSFHTLEAINLSLFSVLQKVGTKNSPPSPPIVDLFPTFTQSNSGKHFQCMERPTEKLANLLCLDCYVKNQTKKTKQKFWFLTWFKSESWQLQPWQVSMDKSSCLDVVRVAQRWLFVLIPKIGQVSHQLYAITALCLVVDTTSNCSPCSINFFQKFNRII